MNKSCCNFFPLSNFTYNSHVIYFLFDKLQVKLMFLFIYLKEVKLMLIVVKHIK